MWRTAGTDRDYWDYWIEHEVWPFQGACKVVYREKDPHMYSPNDIWTPDTPSRPPWVKLFYKARESFQAGTLRLLCTDVRDVEISDVVAAEFLPWARGKGVTIPIELSAIVPNTTVAPDNKHGKRKAPTEFVDALIRLIAEISKRAAEKRIPFDKDNMPGTKKDFMALAIKFDEKFDGLTPRTFDDYVAGLIRFKQGAQGTTFYQELFPEFFDPSGTRGQGRRSTRKTPTP